MSPLPFLIACFAGWMNRRQQVIIEFLQEEIRVLQEQLGKRPRFTDDQRRVWLPRANPLGEKAWPVLPALLPPILSWLGTAA